MGAWKYQAEIEGAEICLEMVQEDPTPQAIEALDRAVTDLISLVKYLERELVELQIQA